MMYVPPYQLLPAKQLFISQAGIYRSRLLFDNATMVMTMPMAMRMPSRCFFNRSNGTTLNIKIYQLIRLLRL